MSQPTFKERFINSIAVEGLTGPWIEKIADRLFADLDFIRIAAEHTNLVTALHEKENHPAYEYSRTEVGRKSAEDIRQPEGNGWEANIHKGNNGFERFDFTEEYYWLRLKSDAAKDNRLPSQTLQPITMPFLHLDDYLKLLRSHICKGYMPSSPLEGIHSKPEYVTANELNRLIHGSGFYAISDGPVIMKSGDLEFNSLSNNIWFAVSEKGLGSVPGTEVLTNLATTETYVRVSRANGKPGEWEKWADYVFLPLDAKVIRSVLSGSSLET